MAPRTHVRTATTIGRRPRCGVPSPPSLPVHRHLACRRQEPPTFTLRCRHHDHRPQPLPPGGARTPARRLAQRRLQRSPIRLTVRQETYCRQAIDIHRLLLQPGRPHPHRFCRRNRLPWPSWMDISKAFNACKRVDYPFVTQVAAVVATGAFRDFGQAVDNWRNPRLRARVPRTKRRSITRHRLLPGGRQHEGGPVRRKAEGETPLPGQRQAGLHPAQGHLLRGQHQEGERPVVHLPEALEGRRSPNRRGPTGPAASTRASTPWAPTPTGRPTGIPKPPTRWSGSCGDGSGPRLGGRRAPGAGGRPSGRSTSATGASGA